MNTTQKAFRTSVMVCALVALSGATSLLNAKNTRGADEGGTSALTYLTVVGLLAGGAYIADHQLRDGEGAKQLYETSVRLFTQFRESEQLAKTLIYLEELRIQAINSNASKKAIDALDALKVVVVEYAVQAKVAAGELGAKAQVKMLDALAHIQDPETYKALLKVVKNASGSAASYGSSMMAPAARVEPVAVVKEAGNVVEKVIEAQPAAPVGNWRKVGQALRLVS